MSINYRCPYIAEWSSFSEEGQIVERRLGPEDALSLMDKGMTIIDIAEKLNAPHAVVTHIIACIPEMMKWRSLMSEEASPPVDADQIMRDAITSVQKTDGEMDVE